jgi:hypothetical protein
MKYMGNKYSSSHGSPIVPVIPLVLGIRMMKQAVWIDDDG